VKRFCSKKCPNIATEYGWYCRKYYQLLQHKEVDFRSKGETKYFMVTPRLRECIKDEIKERSDHVPAT